MIIRFEYKIYFIQPHRKMPEGVGREIEVVIVLVRFDQSIIYGMYYLKDLSHHNKNEEMLSHVRMIYIKGVFKKKYLSREWAGLFPKNESTLLR